MSEKKKGVVRYKISRHASEQMKLRGVSLALVEGILEKPEQIVKEEDTEVFQSVVTERGRKYLIRIFVNPKKNPKLVITAYKTSKIAKYYEG